MANESFEFSGITIVTEPTRTESPSLPLSVLAAAKAQADALKQIGITHIARRTDRLGQEFYVSLGNASQKECAQVQEVMQAMSDIAEGGPARTGRSSARLNYVSFTLPAVA